VTTTPTSTTTGWLRALVDADPSAVAVVEPDGDTVTYGELEARVAALAGGLAAAGLGSGERLASFVPNGLLPVELLLAASRLAAVTIGVNTRYRAGDLRHVLDRARPRVLVAADDFLGIDFRGVVAGALDGAAHPPLVLWPGDVAALRDHRPVVDDRSRPDDLLVAFTTSGTTGLPKLAAHDHATTVRHLQATARSLAVGPSSVGLLAVPFCGTFGFVSALGVLAGGGRVVAPARFEPASAAALVEAHGVTHLSGSDDMLLAVVAAGSDLRTWRHGVTAEFTGRGLESVAAAETVGARVTGVYGSSETFALLARWDEGEPTGPRARSGGRFLDPAMEARVVDTSTGAVLPHGEPGELQFRGPSVLGAYLVEDGTAEPPTQDGWFATGDLAVIEPGGGFVYLARLGDTLRLSGFLTDPAEIEQHLLRHPGVTGAQVVGAPSPRGGDAAVAFVTLDPSAGADDVEAALAAHCRAGLANYKVPARIVVVDAFPTVDGANGVKIRKTELRDRAAELLA
jgi:fatty-acyl-CoA synthase